MLVFKHPKLYERSVLNTFVRTVPIQDLIKTQYKIEYLFRKD